MDEKDLQRIEKALDEEGHPEWIYDFPIDLNDARALVKEVKRLRESKE